MDYSFELSIIQTEIKSQLYLQYVTVDPPYLTGWGLYVVRKGLILLVSILKLNKSLPYVTLGDASHLDRLCSDIFAGSW